MPHQSEDLEDAGSYLRRYAQMNGTEPDEKAAAELSPTVLTPFPPEGRMHEVADKDDFLNAMWTSFTDAGESWEEARRPLWAAYCVISEQLSAAREDGRFVDTSMYTSHGITLDATATERFGEWRARLVTDGIGPEWIALS